MADIRLPQNPGIGGLDELTAAEELTIQQIAGLGDPNADRILFWDDSAGSFQYLTVGSGLTITDTTISASAASIDGSGTTNEIAYWVDSDTLGALAVATYPSLTELSYVKGVTSAIQTQLGTKITASSTDTLTNKTIDANGTGNSITNIDVADLAAGTDGELITWDASGNPTTVAVGTSGQVLTSNGAGAAPTFQDAASGGLSNVVEDTTPQLGGALDGQGNDLNNMGVLFLTEQAEAEADVAGKGQIWVDTATPNVLMFTDDAGTDFIIGNTAGTQTLTNKTIDSASNTLTLDLSEGTLTGTLAEFNTALSDDNFATLGAANAFTVGGHTITVADTANAVGLTINQNDVTNAPIPLRVVNAGDNYNLSIESVDNPGGNGASLRLYSDDSNPSDLDLITSVYFQGKDDGGNLVGYGGIETYATDVSDTSEDSFMRFSAMNAGTLRDLLSIGGNTSGFVNGIIIGDNHAAGVLQSNGNQDLILQTGNATTGSITITDGADGDITIAPNGNGAVRIATELEPTTTGLPLGTGSNRWADLFLEDSAAINFGTGGDVTLTHSTSLLTLAGGDLALAESTSVRLDSVLSADGTYTGTTIPGTAGATLAFGDLVYLAAADSRWELADADSVTTAGPVLLGICVLAAASDGDPTTILLQGTVRADTAFPALTISAPAYVGTSAGDIQVAAPTGDNDVVRIVGHALTADSIYFNPSTDWVVLVV